MSRCAMVLYGVVNFCLNYAEVRMQHHQNRHIYRFDINGTETQYNFKILKSFQAGLRLLMKAVSLTKSFLGTQLVRKLRPPVHHPRKAFQLQGDEQCMTW